MIKCYRVDISTDSSGDFTGSTGVTSGKVVQVRYVVDGTAPLATGATIALAAGKTGVVISDHASIGTSSFTRAYRQATHATDGSAALYASGGEPVLDYTFVSQETIDVTVSGGGDTKAGKLYIYVED